MNLYWHNLTSKDKLKQFGAEKECISQFLVQVEPFSSYCPDHMVSGLRNNLNHLIEGV